MEEKNREKARALYEYIDGSDMYTNPVREKDRSIMNVTFKTNDPELDALFCEEAKKHGIISIKGHRAVGGMRASIYNAMTLEGVKALVEFMKEFEKEHLK